MGTCGDCKHWKQGWTYVTRQRETKVDDTRGECEEVGFASIPIEALDEIFSVSYAIGDDLQLVTHAHFGCNQFKAKQ